MLLSTDGKCSFSAILPEGTSLPAQNFGNGASGHTKWDNYLNGDQYKNGVVHSSKKNEKEAEINVQDILTKYIEWLDSHVKDANTRSAFKLFKKYVQYDDGEEAYNNACVRVGLCFELVGFSNSDSASIGGKKAFAFSWGDLSYTGVNEDPYFVYNMFNEANKNHALATWKATYEDTKAVVTPDTDSNIVFFMYNLDVGNAFGQGMTIAIRSTKDWSASSSGTEVEYDYSADTTAYSSKSPKIDSIIGNESVTSKLKNIYADNSIVSSAGNYPMYMLNKKSSSQEDLDKLAGTKGAARTGTDGKNKVKEASKYFNGVDTSGETKYAIGFLDAEYKMAKSDSNIEENDLYKM